MVRPVTEDNMQDIQDLLDFWFDVDPSNAESLEQQYRRWFASTPEEDHALEQRFGSLARAAAAGELDPCSGSPQGRLALILLLDQFPRNLWRGQAEAFAHDEKALALCLGGIDEGMPGKLSAIERVFFLLPLQHAESMAAQDLSIHMYRELCNEPAPEPLADALGNVADYAVAHQRIVQRFGRFPHRNEALDRESTEEELEYLQSGGARFGQ